MKDKLLKQAIELFEKKGFSETSIQDIVNSCGVTKGTFYYYFNSKSELLSTIQLNYVNELIDDQKAILLSHYSNQRKLKRMVSLLIKKIKSDGASARVFFREIRHIPPDDMNQIIQKRDMIRYNLREVIQFGMDTQEFREDLDIDIVTFAILGMCNWSYSWFNPNGNINEEALISNYLDMVLTGIIPIENKCVT